MNSGQYHHQPQNHGLPSDFHYDGNSATSYQPTSQLTPFDGLPRIQPDQQGLGAWPTPFENYNLATTSTMPFAQASTGWAPASQVASIYGDHASNDYQYYSGSNLESSEAGAFLRDHRAVVPRSTGGWTDYGSQLLNGNDMTATGLEPSSYMIGTTGEASKPFRLSYDHQDSSGDFARLSISGSPKMEGELRDHELYSHNRLPSRNHASEGSADSLPSSREMTAVEAEDHGADEPYAKLIHRALMSAPGHAMVLQEIYQWFRDNTNKGSSDTKGWMNSIRHNLSMNAAFKKTERKICGDDTKKSTEWVLENFAVKDGVQSTTRYRKGTGSKKFFRSDNPAPARQTSGRKGGLCAGKSKMHRQRVKDERSELRRSTSRMDSGRRPNFNHDGINSQSTQRQMSPMTPSVESMPSSSPYFLKQEQLEIPYEDMYGLEDVQAVYLDNTPLFDNSHHASSHHHTQSLLHGHF